MLNRRAITSALIVLTSLNGQPIKADAIQQAQFDANEDVKRAKPIDEEALANHDEEYIDAYLTEYENAAQAKENEQNNALTGVSSQRSIMLRVTVFTGAFDFLKSIIIVLLLLYCFYLIIYILFNWYYCQAGRELSPDALSHTACTSRYTSRQVRDPLNQDIR